MKVTSSTSSTQLTMVQQVAETQLTAVNQQSAMPTPAGDRLEISEEARTRARKGGAARQLDQLGDHASQQMIAFLRDLMKLLSGREVENLELLPDAEGEEGGLPTPQPQSGMLPATAGAMQQTSLSVEQQSLSFSGSITSADGREVAFALDFQFTHASLASQSLAFQGGPEGSSFSFAGTSAELFSTSFSFSFAATDTGADGGRGIGRFNVGDDLAKIGKMMRSALKAD